MFEAVDSMPGWAQRIAAEWISCLPPCGHHRFPDSLLAVVDAIGAESADKFRPGCYTVAPERKQAATDYCLCLDAWLSGASAAICAKELEAWGKRKIGWKRVCRDLWAAMGESTEFKRLFVERTLLAIRHAIKSYTWEGDEVMYCCDQFCGDIAIGEEGRVSIHLSSNPRTRALDNRLSRLRPGWHHTFTRNDYKAWWLCAPKAFRFLERDLWAVGRDKPLEEGEHVPDFLQAEDTWPDKTTASKWFTEFTAALDRWAELDCESSCSVEEDVFSRLGARTPVKRWLVLSYLARLRSMASGTTGFARLVSHPGHLGLL